MRILISSLLLSAVCLGQAGRTLAKSQPKELGQISWYRNLDVAEAQARKLDRPLLVLFQEVPG